MSFTGEEDKISWLSDLSDKFDSKLSVWDDKEILSIATIDTIFYLLDDLKSRLLSWVLIS
jgi:hypothetical protein